MIDLYLQKHKGLLLTVGRPKMCLAFSSRRARLGSRGTLLLRKLHDPIINTAILANRRFQQVRWMPSQLAGGIPPKEMDRTSCELREKESISYVILLSWRLG